MISLSELAPLPVETIQIRGRSVSMRALVAAETARIVVLFPAPKPPLNKQNPNAGSLAAKLPNDDDPAFISAFNTWTADRAVIEVIIACDLGVSGRQVLSEFGDQAAQDALRKASNELRSILTDREIGRAWRKLRELMAPETADSRRSVIELRREVDDIGLRLDAVTQGMEVLTAKIGDASWAVEPSSQSHS